MPFCNKPLPDKMKITTEKGGVERLTTELSETGITSAGATKQVICQ
ncbi:hypothetical protein HQN88_23010 [Paenibacillus qinlingensis]|nr:hypothetical protein [Paenibacillus qinlingensis]